MKRMHLVVASMLLIGVSPVAAQVDAGAPVEIYYDFTLIDGLGGPPMEDAAMAIRGNRILAISSRRELLASQPNAVAIPLGDGYVIPGLIDSHVHLATSPNRQRAEAELYRMLYGGITAVRDMAGDGRALASLARDSRLGEIDAPDIVYAALLAGPTFLEDPRPRASAAGAVPGMVPWMQAFTPETDVVRAIAMARGTSATGVKIYANLEAADVRRITDEAHRQDMLVWAHSMVFPTRPLEVVDAGVDVISHVCRLAWEAMSDAPEEYHHDQVPLYGNFSAESPVFTELFNAMRREGTVLDATLSMYARMDERRRENPDAPSAERCDTEFARSLVRRAAADGVPIIAGTDFTTPPDDPYPALFTELEELVEHGGLTPMQAIQSATSVAAEAIGLGETHGALQHGRAVSFVLLANDPLEDISNLRSIRAVWKNAERFDRGAYRAPVVEAETGGSRSQSSVGLATPRQALDAWLALWRRFDLDGLEGVFLDDPAVSFFSSDQEGLKQGFDEVRAHHETLGFAPGGFQQTRELWLEDPLITDFDESAVITGIWNFGNRVSGQSEGRGPLTMVLVRTEQGYKISHLNLANYPR